MEKHHFLRYNAENQKVKPGDGSKQSITSRRYALPKQNNLFWYEKDRVNDAKRYGFTDQNNLFCFCADGMMRIKEAILMNTGGKNTKTKGQNTGTRVLYPRENDITARRQRHSCVLSVASEQSSRDASSLTKLRLVASLLLALLLGVNSGWAATKDFDLPNGYYYLGNEAGNNSVPKYDGSNFTANFYMCPAYNTTVNERNYLGGDGTKPLITTFKSFPQNGKTYSWAVWYIEKATGDNAGYFYIKHKETGQYLVANDNAIPKTNRRRVNLGPTTKSNSDDLFKIQSDDEGVTYYISSKTRSDGNNKYLNPSKANLNDLSATNDNDYTGGILGFYWEKTTNSAWHFVSVPYDAPVITNNFDGTFTIESGTGATIYYTTDGSIPTTSSPNTGTTSVNINQTGDITVIKAIASTSEYAPSKVTTYTIPRCSRPAISVNGGIVTITCATSGATIYYTTDDSHATTSSSIYNAPFAKGNATTIRAIATRVGYIKSNEAALQPPTQVSSSNDITDMNGNYILADNFTLSSSIGTSENPFHGTIDGNMVTRTFGFPLVAYADGATIKNVILDNVTISGGTNAGAICNEATGETRIYNCGVLATNSEVETDKDGYTHIKTCSSTISGSGSVGGIVGLLDGSSRVINCFSYANITGGNLVGGIVGNNNVATTSGNLQTMVMNCMFYGDIDNSCTSKAPIYNGTIISNRSDASGVSNFNYFWGGASYVQGQDIDVYNCALSAETRFLQRFEFFRHLLNSNRELAAWWATDDSNNKDNMMKWVLEPSQIGTSTPYPILKMPFDSENHIIKYPSVVNIDAAHAEAFSDDAATAKTQYNQGRKFDVTFTISIENATSGAPNNANITTSSVTRNITDKDPKHFNFNYYKVQLPYYNDVGTKNYTENKVVTGWEITVSGGTHNFTTSSDASASVNEAGEITLTTPYNFADRKSTEKDNYATNGNRIFNQGAYYDVPEGVTSITIKPHWANCVYVSDQYSDVVYNKDMNSASPVTTIGGGARYADNTITIDGSSQTVYTSMSAAVLALSPSGAVYDNAIVLVGNFHSLSLSSETDNMPYTIMSIDQDKDNEPDYSYILRFNDRVRVHPVRVDFLNVIGLGMAQKSHEGQGTYNLGIMQPLGWFEATNTALFRVTQFEYDRNPRSSAPMILHGGVIEQWVTVAETSGSVTEANAVDYYHVGSNVWFKEFHIGAHQDRQAVVTPHPPISVTGGDFDEFYLTGLYNTPNTNYDDNAECYINGGRFGKVAGTGMQGIGHATDNTNGNIIWQIDNADIDEFYAGGINAAHIAEGNIWTIISNSRADQFCGGPKFGDMNNGTKVVTNATNCTFRTFFGAGYGGNSYNREYPRNKYDNYNYGWDSWLASVYKKEYKSAYKGISTRIDYQFIPKSDNLQNVARLFVDYVSFSLATTHNVTSKLTGCTITRNPLGRLKLFDGCIGNFYGGGSLGKVTGNVNSTLLNCTVEGNAFGAGYSATLPTVAVMENKFQTEPHYDTFSGSYLEAKLPATPNNYTWVHTNTVNSTATAIDKDNHILYTTEDLTTLGAVTGNATLTINGSTTVAGSVYGGGEESTVGGNTTVTVESGTIGTDGLGGAEYGNVYGGGKGKEYNKTTGLDAVTAGLVKGNTNVTISGSATKILHNVYGGGAYGSVGEYEYDATTKLPTKRKDETTGGTTNVTITSGTIGTNGDSNGMVFGSSRGNVAKPDADLGRDPNDLLAWVYDTNITIGTADQGPRINGSIYGSGENGHTFNDAKVDVHSGTIGIEDKNNVVTNNGKRYEGAQYPYRGNVYGGGCGTDTYQDEGPDPKDPSKTKTFTYYNFLAGIVRGNTTVNIDGGHIIHNVYGGGAMGSVGTYSFNAENMPTSCATGTGLCTVTISGGDIGADDMKMTAAERPDDFGHVFGAGRGNVHDSIDYPNVQKTAYYNNTKLTIKGTAFVRGSVYGGSESGHVLNDTHVVIGGTTSSDDPQIGNGDGVNRRYTTAEWEEGKPDVLKATNHWTYIDNGAPYDQFADENGYYTTEYAEGGRQVATDGHTFYGNVFGGGSGYYPYTQGKWLFSAGSVGGKTKVEILSGHILNNVYGGCEMSDVTGSATIEMKGGTVGVPRTNAQINLNPSFGHIFGAGMGDKRIFFNTVTNVASTDVEVSGGRVYGSVHGGGEDGHILGDAKTTISGDVVIGSNEKTELEAIFGFDGNVFGGGQGSPTALTAGTVGGNVELNIMGGTMLGSVYGGGRIASVGTFFRKATDENYGKMQEGDNHGLITVNLTGGTIKQNVYGGGMGIKRGFSAEGVDKELFAISKTVTVNLNLENKVADNAVGCVVKGNIFGCNNVNSSPQETVTVNVGGTQREGASQIAYTASATDAKVKGGNDVTKYDVKGVYGGGNMAAYKPNGGKETTYSTHVNISGCYRTSIGQVYGGGNAASTPATNVTVDGAYEIYELFGGGNGKDQVSYDGTNKEDNPGANVGFYQYDDNITDETATTEKPASDTPEKRSNNYGYGSGEATVNIFGGLLHCVFGGSNTKGNVCKTALTLLEEGTSCAFCVDEVYGGGKSAPMDAEAKLLMQCIPGLKAAYGGAEAADIQGGVTLNITNGTFDQVFGGNNLSGTIRGPIVVNIEETGCKPIIIGELYGGGNQAGYSVYGYDVDNTGNTILKESGSSRWEDPQVNVKSFTSIGNIYGGGLGEDAVMVGDPKVNINVAVGDNASAVIGENATTETIRTGNANAQGGYPVPKHDSGKIGAINNVFGGGNSAKVIGNTQVKIGTESTIDYVTKATGETNPRTGITVEGVNIRGNVYGGGNNAEVTGNTEVIIGKKQE